MIFYDYLHSDPFRNSTLQETLIFLKYIVALCLYISRNNNIEFFPNYFIVYIL